MKKQSTSTKKRSNLMQFTLSDEGIKILEQFSTKYGTSKSIIIDRALMFLAGQYHRKIVVSYELLTEDQDTTTTTTEPTTISVTTTKKRLPHKEEYHRPDEVIDIKYERNTKIVYYGDGTSRTYPIEAII